MSTENFEQDARLSDNARRIAFIEQCFGTAGIPLSQPGRVLVAEGVLTKLSGNKPRPKQFFLFNNLLMYGAIIIAKRKFNKQRIIHLSDVQVEDIEDVSGYRNCFVIRTPDKLLKVSTSTFEEKIEWTEHIHLFAENCRNLRRRSVDFLDPPVWVPDSKASLCMVCNKTEFTIVNRKHHCRHCGFVVCASCSTQRFLLPRQSSSAVRVCDPCFRRLTQTNIGSEAVPSVREEGSFVNGRPSSHTDSPNQNSEVLFPVSESVPTAADARPPRQTPSPSISS